MDRQIVCFSIPALSISLARLDAPSLRTRPIAVAASQSPRSLIAETSQEAQQEGVWPGLHITQAKQRCPALHILPPQTVRIHHAHQALTNTIRQFSPVWEPIQPGHVFFDLTGTTRLFGSACDVVMQIEREITRQQGLIGVAGLASNKLVSRIASTVVCPPQLCDIRPGSEEAFLAPLPLQTLPLGPQQSKTLLPLFADLNIQTLKDLASIHLPHLEMVLGRPAGTLHAWAHGADPSPVLCPPQQPHIEATIKPEPDEIDLPRLQGALYQLLERVCQQLRDQQRICHVIVVGFQYRDGLEIMKALPVRPGTYWETELMPLVTKLCTRNFVRRVRVSRLTIRAERLTGFIQQGELFHEERITTPFPVKKAQRLTLALDHIRKRFGAQAIWWGRTHAHDTLRAPSRSF
ncbi:MAG: hypothetical protein MRJ96_08430 [Nitrospirales bacterium]|nr:hypothetical protein [Nitrospira sp.]MDR4501459.1 hypothetical protein [Nitrospirales bacterium]